jgi:starch phosphorylase
VDAFASNRFCPQEPGLFHWMHHALLDRDEYFHLADLPSYLAAQTQVSEEFKNQAVWARKAILNAGRIGKFSSDRTILEYAREIWHLAT